MDDINKELEKLMDNRNSTGIIEFEGYSPEEMYRIIHFLFDDNCAVRIKKLNPEDFSKIPIYKGIRFLVNYLLKNEKIKLTAKGFLPTKIVADLYNQKYFPEEIIEIGISKLYKETDSLFVNLSRILLELSGNAKKVKGTLTLTIKGKKCLNNEQLLFEDLLSVYCKKFNWGYFDGYEMSDIGSLGCGYTILLLNNYGGDKNNSKFYAQKYFTAYPMLKENVKSIYRTVDDYVSDCYSLRTFERFGSLFGLIKFDKKTKYNEPIVLQKTELFDAIFECLQPQNSK